MTERVCIFGCGQPPNDEFDIGEIYWHIDCYTEGRFEAVVLPVITAKLEGKIQSDRERLEAFLAARNKLTRDDAMKAAVQQVMALDPNAISDPVGFQKQVSAVFKRISGERI